MLKITSCAHRTAWLCALLAILVAPAGFAADDAVGAAAPALIVRQLDGHEFDLQALKGHVVVLNLWATWCPPCRAEMPLLDAFARKYAGRGLVLFGASADDPHDRKEVVKVMHAFSYPAGLLTDATANGYGSPQVLPVSYVIGPDGRIRARLLPGKGALTEKELADAVEPLLAPTAP
jgi:thiol-disulfide isomerase/thioredoxin